jgi:hypothetical protein
LYTREIQEIEPIEYRIEPEQEFWDYCSNMQLWVECGYDTNVLHSNLSFPLLKALTEEGDLDARRVFSEEIVKRFNGHNAKVKKFLAEEGYLEHLNEEEKTHLEVMMECYICKVDEVNVFAKKVVWNLDGEVNLWMCPKCMKELEVVGFRFVEVETKIVMK